MSLFTLLTISRRKDASSSTTVATATSVAFR